LALIVAVGTPVAFMLSRYRFPGHRVLDALIDLPMVLPPVVTGLLLLELFGRTSAVGGFFAGLGLPLSFSFTGAVIAALVVGLPLYVWSARVAFEAVDPRFEEVSRALGVSPWRTFKRVTLPLAMPGLAAGAVLAFARGLGEFGPRQFWPAIGRAKHERSRSRCTDCSTRPTGSRRSARWWPSASCRPSPL
jgi:molybdate transport system permease protein